MEIIKLPLIGRCFPFLLCLSVVASVAFYIIHLRLSKNTFPSKQNGLFYNMYYLSLSFFPNVASIITHFKKVVLKVYFLSYNLAKASDELFTICLQFSKTMCVRHKTGT